MSGCLSVPRAKREMFESVLDMMSLSKRKENVKSVPTAPIMRIGEAKLKST